MGVAHQVVHPIDIEFARDELAEPALTGDQSRDRLGFEVVLPKHVPDGPVGEQVVDVVVVAPRSTVGQRLEVVAERAVTDVVKQGGGVNSAGSPPLDPESLEGFAGEMIDAEAVFEASVVGRGVDQGDGAELADVSQPLYRRRIQQITGDAVDLNVIVDAVLDDLHWFLLGPFVQKLSSPGCRSRRLRCRRFRRTDYGDTHSPRSSLRSIASSTCWAASPSSKFGSNSCPFATALRNS